MYRPTQPPTLPGHQRRAHDPGHHDHHCRRDAPADRSHRRHQRRAHDPGHHDHHCRRDAPADRSHRRRRRHQEQTAPSPTSIYTSLFA